MPWYNNLNTRAKLFLDMKTIMNAEPLDKNFTSQYIQQWDKETTNAVSQDGRHRQSSPTFRSGTAQQPSNAGPSRPSKYTFITFVNPEPRQAIAFEEAGIRAGEVIAHRAWWALNDKLFSVYMTDFEWDPKIPMEGEPKFENGWGIHAFKSAKDVDVYVKSIIDWYAYDRNFYRPSIVQMGAKLVTGTVSLWGEIVEHEKGYRAEFARPVSIDINTDSYGKAWGSDRELLNRYGVKANVRTGS